jgi:3-phosphoshikimate 1-carboxyvinyltransferase
LFVIIQRAKTISGRIAMPGDKSISHRAAMIAALAEGTSSIKNFSKSADCAATLSCLKRLGVSIEHVGDNLSIAGVGLDGLREPEGPLDCGNSGTTMRLLAGILCGQDFKSTLTGDDSLRSRPMQRIIVPLEMMGANISSQNGRAPLEIRGHKTLQAISYELLVASAQVKSCILLAGLNISGRTEVIESEITRDHTERMLRHFGAEIDTGDAEREGENARFAVVNGPARLGARKVFIPGDISGAAYFIATAGLLNGSSLEIVDVGLNPTRVLFLEQLRALGLNVEIAEVREESDEPLGTIRVSGERNQTNDGGKRPFRIDGLIIPQLIDELPLLAVVGSQVDGGIEIRDAAELRVKESDRIAATAQNLRAMGASVEEFEDGLRVDGPAKLLGAVVDPRGDHRIAMAFSVAGLIAAGETEIKDAECVAVSFPEFFDLLDSVVQS